VYSFSEKLYLFSKFAVNEWHGSDVVLSSEFFAQTGAHDLSSEMTWSIEMSFSALSGTAGDGGVLFGHFSLQLNFCKFDLRL